MTCTRCRGRMVRELFTDMLDDTGQMDFLGWRCLNCGEILDGIVVSHRTSNQLRPYRSQRRWTSGIPKEWGRDAC